MRPWPVIMLAGVTAAMVWFMVRYRRSRNPNPAQIEGNVTLEEVKASRHREAENAASALGTAELICFDLGDYPLHLDAAATDRLVDVFRKDDPDHGYRVTRAVVWNLAKVMLIKDEVYVSALLTSPEKYRRDRKRFNVIPERGDKITYRHHNRPEFDIFGRRIRFEHGFDFDHQSFCLDLMSLLIALSAPRTRCRCRGSACSIRSIILGSALPSADPGARAIQSLSRVEIAVVPQAAALEGATS